MSQKWLEWAKELQAIAQAGLTYSKDVYDLERFEQIRQVSVEIMSQHTNTDMERIEDLFANETGYPTPKVDVRGVIFQDQKILMVRERLEGCWSLPGGWADIGYTPGEVTVKEIKEETGFDARPVRLLAVLDKKCHPHPPSPYHVYKIFMECELVGGAAVFGIETDAVGFFGIDDLPNLSVERNTESQIRMLFSFLKNPDQFPIFD